MKELTCVVAGGGFAGIHALKAIHKALQNRLDGQKLRLVLLDQRNSHVRKVLLFRPAVSGEAITVSWQQVMPEETQFIQGNVTSLDQVNRLLGYKDLNGRDCFLQYDVLVMALGSIVRRAAPEQGGISLTGIETAERIRECWHSNLKRAAETTDLLEKQRLMTAAIAGGGITGIETAAEMVYAMRSEAVKLGLDPERIQVHLFNSEKRLFSEGPLKVGARLARYLADLGVIVHHERYVIKEEDGRVHFKEGDPLPTGLTVWTLGLTPNPVLQHLGLPTTMKGQIVVDESYRVHNAPGIYSIGDCAHIVDPVTGAANRMTCREAIPQATRLGRILKAELIGTSAEKHKETPKGYVVGLGPGNGLVWTWMWGIDLMITGKLAYKIKEFVWDYSSMV